MKYPIGIQTFEKIRTEGYVYVDKTRLVYELTHAETYVFLSRPRRFGKSLLLSTIKSYFQGRQDLFEDLEIQQLETEWISYPVIHIDLVSGLYNSIEGLRQHLDYVLSNLERQFNVENPPQGLSSRFDYIIQTAYHQRGQKVVILVDEYDKPLLEAIGNRKLQEAFRDELRALYSVIKSQDEHIRFAMLTGVTEFGHLNVFSGLNNISDVSFYKKYAAICGITQNEIYQYFDKPIETLAEIYNLSKDEMVDRLRLMYDGYRFSKSETKVFNPYSLLNTFNREEIGAYWFATGTPKFLVELLKIHRFKLWELEGSTADESQLCNMDSYASNPIPVIYQSGYLTITDYNARRDNYTLGFPNEEVRKGFMQYLLPFYASTRDHKTFDIDAFVDDILDGKADQFMKRLECLTADISYEILAHCEDDFQNLLYIIFTLSSLRPIVERCTSDGRIDMVVETPDFIYLMEFKIDDSAQGAIAQINSKDYALPWALDHRKVIKIGANFSTSQRLTDYIII